MTFEKLAVYFSQLEKTSSRLKITEILAKLLKESSPGEIKKVCYLSLGRLAPLYEGKEFNLAEKLLIRVLIQTYGKKEKEIKAKYKQLGDLGNTAAFFDRERSVKPLSVSEVYQRLWEVTTEAGEGSVERKIRKMSQLLFDLDPLSVKYVTRIPLGRLRLGFSELTVLDALSWMISGDKSKRSEIEEAFEVRADIGQIAQLVKEKGMGKLGGVKVSLGVPVISALCQRLPDPEEMIKKMAPRQARGKALVAVEPKYDGTRLQVHWGRQKLTRIFTRNLENVTLMFPDIAAALPKELKAKAVILDGEAIGYNPKTGKFLPFQETIKRKRKYEISQKALEIPLKYFVFDVLYQDGKDLLKVPFSQRRQILEKIIAPGAQTLIISPQIVTENAADLRRFHDEQIEKGLEGVVVKKWQAPYDPGRRGYTWVKFKSEKNKKGGGLTDTLDCVVMGYYKGKGKRTRFGIGAFLVGIRESEKTDKFLTISKIGTGLTDEQWREMHRRCEKTKASKKPSCYQADKNLLPDVWCGPKIVVEIQADNITISPIHAAGLALRFPRLIRFRDDKSALQATTLSEAKKLYHLQK